MPDRLDSLDEELSSRMGGERIDDAGVRWWLTPSKTAIGD